MSNHASMLRVTDEDGIVEVRVMTDAVVDESSIQHQDRGLKDLIDGREAPKLIVDFGNVRHLSSSALGTLISVNSAVQDRGGELRLAAISGAILEVFRITKLDRIFVIDETTEDARIGLR